MTINVKSTNYDIEELIFRISNSLTGVFCVIVFRVMQTNVNDTEALTRFQGSVALLSEKESCPFVLFWFKIGIILGMQEDEFFMNGISCYK